MSINYLDRLGTPFAVEGQVSLTSSFTITGTTPNLQDATTVTCILMKQ
jgi:hypothetical protein